MYKTLSFFSTTFLTVGLSLFSSIMSIDLEAKPTIPPFTLYKEHPFQMNQLIAPDFDQLPEQRKLFAKYLSLASQAGGDIFWKQYSRYGLQLRNFSFELLRFSSLAPNADVLKAVRDYAALLYYSGGNYDRYSNQKFTIQPEYEAQVRQWIEAIGSKSKAAKKRLEAVIGSSTSEISRQIFDATYFPQRVVSSDGNSSVDLISGSSTGFYGEGVTEGSIEHLKKKKAVGRGYSSPYDLWAKGLHSVYVDPKSKTPKIMKHKVGARFTEELLLVKFYLQKAQEVANSEEAKILSAYVKAIDTGNPSDLKRAEILWTRYKPVDLEWQVGFVENYLDPKGVQREWEGFVTVLDQDPNSKRAMEILQKALPKFEKTLPGKPEFQRTDFSSPPTGRNASFVSIAGEIAARPFWGVNLPNDDAISDKWGTKNLSIKNLEIEEVETSAGKSLPTEQNDEKLLKELVTPPALHEVREEFSSKEILFSSNLQVMFHEILGHGSGKFLEGKNKTQLEDFSMPLEEARAETTSLYRLLDPLAQEIGVFPKDWSPEKIQKFKKFVIYDFFHDHLQRVNRSFVEGSIRFSQAHTRARQLMLNWLIEDGILKISYLETKRGRVAQLEFVEGFTLDHWRNRLYVLLAKIQELTSTADLEGTKTFFAKYEVFNPQMVEAFTTNITFRKQFKEFSRTFFVGPTFSKNDGDVKLRYQKEGYDLISFIHDEWRRIRSTDHKKKALLETYVGQEASLKDLRDLRICQAAFMSP